MSDLSIPAADHVDAAWLTRVLDDAGLADGAVITSIDATPIGTGQVGENVRFLLRWDRTDPSLPTSVVGKFPSPSELSRSTAVQVGTYVREVGFYRELQPRVGVRSPHIHHVSWDPESHDFAVIMEDLSDSSPGNQLTGCTVDHARAAAIEIAGLHAPTWGATAALERDWIVHPDAGRAAAMTATFAATLPGFVDRYGERLGEQVVDVAWRATSAYPTLAAAVADWAEGVGEWCVVHGDYRLDNLLFGDTPEAPAVVVVDWQTTSIGIGPADVAYLLGSGLLADDRRAHDRDVVGAYADALRAGGVDVDDATVWEGYVLGAAGGLLMAVVASQIVERTDRGDEMFMVMAERHTTQIDDVGLLDVLGV